MKKSDKALLIKWLERIQEMATTKKTANGYTMSDEDCLDEIRVYTKELKEYAEMNF